MTNSTKAGSLARWIAVATAIGLLAGCGKKEESSTTTTTETAPAESPAAGAMSSPDMGATSSGAATSADTSAATGSDSAAGMGAGSATTPATSTGTTSTTTSTTTTTTGSDTSASAAGTGASTTAAGGGSDTDKGHQLMTQSDCFSCHSVDQKIVGPAYEWVAYKYKGKKGADKTLAEKVIKGGAGNWNAYTGGVPMPPHPQLTPAQAKEMVDWVLKQKPVAPPKA